MSALYPVDLSRNVRPEGFSTFQQMAFAPRKVNVREHMSQQQPSKVVIRPTAAYNASVQLMYSQIKGIQWGAF